MPDRSEVHYLWFGRCASAGMLALSIALAFYAQSVMQLFVNSIKIIGLLGASFWLGVTWRRANAPGVWASVLGGALVWGLLSWAGASAGSRLPAALAPAWLESLALHLAHWPEPVRVLVSLAVQFGALIAVSLMTRRPSDERLDPFYARLLTPVGREGEVLLAAGAAELPESATLGMEGVLLDYRKASRFGYAGLRRLGIELPRLTWFDGAGFLAAWCQLDAQAVDSVMAIPQTNAAEPHGDNGRQDEKRAKAELWAASHRG